MLRQIACVFILALCWAAPAQAHFPWIKIESGEGKHGVVLFYFEHAPKAGDGGYLDPFVQRGKFWSQSPGDDAQPIELADTKQGELRWLQAELAAPAPMCVDLYTTWGVYRYGQTDTLLHYYARNIDAASPQDVAQLAESKHLKLQLQPALADGELTVRVTWEGKPLANQQVALRSPTVARNFQTNDEGMAHIPLDRAGQYALRTKLVEKDAGEFDGKAYAEAHHHSTLVMRLKASAD